VRGQEKALYDLIRDRGLPQEKSVIRAWHDAQLRVRQCVKKIQRMSIDDYIVVPRHDQSRDLNRMQLLKSEMGMQEVQPVQLVVNETCPFREMRMRDDIPLRR
jgi:hypothetical protein